MWLATIGAGLEEGILRRITMASAVVALLLLAGCTTGSQLVDGSSVTVAVAESFTSYNPNTGYGSAVATNPSVVAATNSSFASYDATLELVPDESFGSYELVSERPLTVRYTIAPGVRWSDGVEVDAADLLLSWAANSTSLNDAGFDPAEYIDQGTGMFSDGFPLDVVYFDGFTGNALQHVTQTPQVSDDARSITLVFDEYVADWQLLFGVGVPAHVVARQALTVDGEKITDAAEAKAAIVDAIEQRDESRLARLSRTWNTAFNFTETPKDRELLVSNGPYTISEIVAGDHLTLVANPEYRGEHSPRIAEITVRFISDPLQAVRGLENGDVDVIAPQATAEVVGALEEISGIRVMHGVDGAYEQLELQFDGGASGAFDDPLVREAFLHVVPRESIVDELVRPVQADAEPRLSHVFMPGEAGYDDAVPLRDAARFDGVDVKAATTLLAQAAASDPSLASPTVCILFDPANPRRLAEFQLIQASAAPAGFQVTDCSTGDWQELLGVPAAYDAALYGLRVRNLSVATVESRLRTGSSLNFSHYSNATVDAMLDELARGVTAGERRELLAAIDARLWADSFGMPLYQFPVVTAVSERVDGVRRAPFAATVLGNPWEWRPARPE